MSITRRKFSLSLLGGVALAPVLAFAVSEKVVVKQVRAVKLSGSIKKQVDNFFSKWVSDNNTLESGLASKINIKLSVSSGWVEVIGDVVIVQNETFKRAAGKSLLVTRAPLGYGVLNLGLQLPAIKKSSKSRSLEICPNEGYGVFILSKSDIYFTYIHLVQDSLCRLSVPELGDESLSCITLLDRVILSMRQQDFSGGAVAVREFPVGVLSADVDIIC
ncbi:hypothetical protein SAMN05216600_1025 [Pseudomonas cuatrocienegasensis]|uniref:Uncharacterized protein n=1 Tax=Pseudomonas cuatrocienegasensis TaxID=543360 RepID=A0ABY1B3F2_9PSED|nr:MULTISPECIES: hypothetical protein [Pseudomonas]SEP84050.1 hypothetical protein SAMN05216600_1025 [Pseudomonas cuatrocienegasensis]